jgi:NADH dehydrogenase
MILGAGFAGMYAALSAARLREDLISQGMISTSDVAIGLVSRVDYFTPRPRMYEKKLIKQPIKDILSTVDVNFYQEEITNIDPDQHRVWTYDPETSVTHTHHYDQLVFALGSRVFRPDIPGINEFTFDVDTYVGASRLRAHLEGQDRTIPVVVVGAGFTGLEIATELAGEDEFKVILVDRNPRIGDALGDYASHIIAQAIKELGITAYADCGVLEFKEHGVVLSDGTWIESHTVVWCGGMSANHLTECIAGEKDRSGRIKVSQQLQHERYPNIFVAGDAALVHTVDDSSPYAMMSCQHGSIQGLSAGYNALAHMYNLEKASYAQEPYITCLDLGRYGALLTHQWDRIQYFDDDHPLKVKKIKQNINNCLSFPTGTKEEILKFMKPLVCPVSYDDYIDWAQGK